MTTETNVLVEQQHRAAVASAIAEVAECRPFDFSKAHGPWYWRIKRWSDKALVACASTLLACALLGVVVAAGRAMNVFWAVLGWPIVISAAVAELTVLTIIASDTVFTLLQIRKPGRYYKAESESDYEHANALTKYSVAVLADADLWYEHKIKRHERRQMRLFGGTDKLALVVVATGAWAAWKAAQGTLASLPTDPVLWAGAFYTGLVVGGLIVNRAIERLGYSRDILKWATTLRLRVDAA